MKVEGVITEYKGEEFFDESRALAQLLLDDVVFTCETKTAYNNEISKDYSITCAVNCNDVFAWGCADAQEFDEDDLKELYRMHMDEKNKHWGSTKWCCKKRNLQPQGPVISKMKEDGVWDKEMKKLKENKFTF